MHYAELDRIIEKSNQIIELAETLRTMQNELSTIEVIIKATEIRLLRLLQQQHGARMG